MTINKPPEKIIEESYYSLFQVKWEPQPTSVKFNHVPNTTPPFANKQNNLFKNISKMSSDNK